MKPIRAFIDNGPMDLWTPTSEFVGLPPMPTTAMLWDSIKAMLPESQPAVQPGKALVVGLPDDTAERTVRLAEGLEVDSCSSLYHDLTHDKPMEFEALNGRLSSAGGSTGSRSR